MPGPILPMSMSAGPDFKITYDVQLDPKWEKKKQ
jgi:hypothetical protein